MPIPSLDPATPIVKPDGTMEDAFRLFTVVVAALGIDTGTGSPENVVSANQRALYMDDAGTAGNILYIKKSDDVGGDTKKGWILI